MFCYHAMGTYIDGWPSVLTGEKGNIMEAYMVIKVMRDGSHKAEFLNDPDELDAYLLGLRSIDREYMVFVWTRDDAYQLVRRFQPGKE